MADAPKTAHDVRQAFTRGILNSNTAELIVQRCDLELLCDIRQLTTANNTNTTSSMVKLDRAELATICGVELPKHEALFYPPEAVDDDVDDDGENDNAPGDAAKVDNVADAEDDTAAEPKS